MSETIVKWLKVGADLDTASAAAGVGRRTVTRWIRDGERLRRLKAENPQWEPRGHEVDLFRFAEAVDIARAESEIGDVAAIAMATRDRKVDGRTVTGDWRAAAYRLDRRDRSKAATSFAAATGGTGAGYSLSAPQDDDDGDDDGADVIDVLCARLDELAARRTSSAKAKAKR